MYIKQNIRSSGKEPSPFHPKALPTENRVFVVIKDFFFLSFKWGQLSTKKTGAALHFESNGPATGERDEATGTKSET